MGILAGNRGGRGLGGNRLILLLLFVGIAAFLHYKDEAHPWQSLKADILGVFGIKPEATAEKKTPKPSGNEESTAADHRTGSSSKVPPNADASDLEAYLPAYGSDAEIVRHDAFILRYEEAYEQARWVVHWVLNKTGNAKRATQFSPDPLVPTGSALPADYTRSGYDRGHMAPAGDFKYSQTLTTETFYMSNMSPQDHALNIGFWNDLEAKVRSWSKKYGALVVMTGPVLKPGLPTIGHKNKVAVPEQYFKIVYDPQRQKAVAFLVENRNYPDSQLQQATVAIDEIERLSGVDFLAGLPDSLEKSLESRNNAGDWF